MNAWRTILSWDIGPTIPGYGRFTVDSPEEMDLVGDHVKVSLDWIGEGEFGDYDPEDPEDRRLMRFGVYEKDDAGGWVFVEDSSYCSGYVSVDDSLERKKKFMLYLYTAAVDEKSEGTDLRDLRKFWEMATWWNE